VGTLGLSNPERFLVHSWIFEPRPGGVSYWIIHRPRWPHRSNNWSHLF